MKERRAVNGQDATTRPVDLLLWWALPIAALFAAGYLVADSRLLGAVWAAAFGTMGAKCVGNALRCGRVHCYFTGPWFLLAAAASLVHGFGLMPFEGATWDRIGNGALLGALVLYYGSEWALGRYRHLHGRDDSARATTGTNDASK